MRLYIKSAGRILKKNWISLVLFELTYRIFAMFALTKLVETAMDISLKQLGYSYLTTENYQSFVRYPLTIVLALLLLIVVCAALTFEISAILGCYERSWRKKHISFPGMILEGVRRGTHFIRRHPVKWFFYMLLCAPYLCIHFLIWQITQTRLLQFTLQQLLKDLGHGGLLIAAMILLFIVSMIFSFSLPRRMMTEERDSSVSRYLFERMRRGWKRDLPFALLMQVGAALLAVLLYFAAIAAMVGISIAVKSPANLVSAVLVYGGVIRYCAGVVVGGLGISLTLLYLYTFFARSQNKRRAARPRRKGPSRFRVMIGSRYMLVCLTLLILLSESILLLLQFQTEMPVMAAAQSPVNVTAHRGGAKMAPENTLSAMEYAVEALADFAEIDVQETKDGEIVLLHDTNLKRTTGLKADIWNLTYDEVRQLDAGVKFNKKFRGEQIPTLGEVIQYCKGKIRLNIEVKYNGHNQNIVKKVVKIIEENEFEDDCVVTSMNYKFLQQVKKENSDIQTGYTLRMTYGDLSELTDADFFSVKHTYINPEFVEEVHRLGKEVYAWTVNYQGDMQRMIDCNVDNIITDEPELVRKVILGETGRNPSFFTLFGYALK